MVSQIIGHRGILPKESGGEASAAQGSPDKTAPMESGCEGEEGKVQTHHLTWRIHRDAHGFCYLDRLAKLENRISCSFQGEKQG